MQQHFNVNIFEAEVEFYRSEDVPIPELSFNDNRDVLELIMKKPNGIIMVLDEEGLVPKVRSHFYPVPCPHLAVKYL